MIASAKASGRAGPFLRVGMFAFLGLSLAVAAACQRDALRTLNVEATGENFRWLFRYPGIDGILYTADDLFAEDVLRLPEHVQVKLKLRSHDYIYAFGVPQLDLTEIAVPELDYALDFRTEKLGRFDVVADPLCALTFLHDDVVGKVVIESTDAFERWQASLVTTQVVSR